MESVKGSEAAGIVCECVCVWGGGDGAGARSSRANQDRIVALRLGEGTGKQR